MLGLETETQYKSELALVDLSNFQSVVGFARSLENEPIDILVLNAAVETDVYEATTDGWESRFVVSVYAHHEVSHAVIIACRSIISRVPY